MLIGCQQDDVSAGQSPFILTLNVSVWNEGALFQLPVDRALELTGGGDVDLPTTFVFDAGPMPVVALDQSMTRWGDPMWSWRVRLTRYDAQRFMGVTDTFYVNLNNDLSGVSLRPSPDSPLTMIGASAAAGAFVVIRQIEGRWRVFNGPNAFVDSGASPGLEKQVRERVDRPQQDDRVSSEPA